MYTGFDKYNWIKSVSHSSATNLAPVSTRIETLESVVSRCIDLSLIACDLLGHCDIMYIPVPVLHLPQPLSPLAAYGNFPWACVLFLPFALYSLGPDIHAPVPI